MTQLLTMTTTHKFPLQCPMDGCLYTMDSEVYCFSEGGYDTMEDVCA